jgi:DNA-binding NtrC family response regulator
MATILVIDDDVGMRVIVEQLLKAAGHKVILAGDGSEGIRRCRTEPADLVITDIFMPGQDGVQTIMQFRNLFPQVPVIAMSGISEGEMLAVAQTLGAVALLKKPFDHDQLLNAVEKAL